MVEEQFSGRRSSEAEVEPVPLPVEQEEKAGGESRRCGVLNREERFLLEPRCRCSRIVEVALLLEREIPPEEQRGEDKLEPCTPCRVSSQVDKIRRDDRAGAAVTRLEREVRQVANADVP